MTVKLGTIHDLEDPEMSSQVGFIPWRQNTLTKTLIVHLNQCTPALGAKDETDLIHQPIKLLIKLLPSDLEEKKIILMLEDVLIVCFPR